MPVQQLTSEQVERARTVDQLLADLSGELQVSLNPHRQALRHLGLEKMGWVNRPYAEEAWLVWTEALQRAPDDFETVHHLAIMHHARALDTEAGKDPGQSDADWLKALEYWRRLWKTDAFWDRLVELACKNTKPDAVEQLREEFPALLLKIHYDIAFDPKTPNHRARFHIQTARGADFPQKTKEQVSRATYDSFIRGSVPASVWQPNEMNTDVIKQGTDRIERYLEIDEGCLAALEDALRLQDRLLKAWFTEFQSLGEGDAARRKSLLTRIKQAAEHWKAYFEQMLAAAGDLADDLRRKLAFWYRVMGDVHLALDRAKDAKEFFERGARVGGEDNDERQICARQISFAHATIALDLTRNKNRAARATCDEVRRRADLSVYAYLRLANAYALLEDFDQAEALCRAGMSLQPEGSDFREMQEHEEALRHLAELLDYIPKARKQQAIDGTLSKAKGQMEARRFSDALTLLNQAERASPDSAGIYFLRCQCYIALSNKQSAAADLKRFKQLAGDSSDVKKAVAQLELMVRN